MTQNFAFAGVDATAAFFTPQVERNLLSQETWGQLQDRLRSLRSDRLLAMAATDAVEARRAAYTLAWQLSRPQPGLLGAPGEALEILEWRPGVEPIPIQETFSQTSEPSVFLLLGVTPVQFRHGLRELSEAVRGSDHFVLMTTSVAPDQWTSEAQEDLWWSLRMEELYPKPYLLRYFLSSLEGDSVQLPSGCLPLGLPRNPQQALTHPFVEGLTIGHLVNQVETPNHVRSFLNLLQREEGAVTAAEVMLALERSTNHELVVDEWYLALPIRLQQLVALVLLFDRLSFDQLFALLELLSRSCFRSLDPGFVSFDTHELQSLGDYIEVNDLGEGNLVIQWASFSSRQRILDRAWKSHRRFFQALLPALANLLFEAANLRLETRDEEILNEAKARRTQRKRSSRLRGLAGRAMTMVTGGGLVLPLINGLSGLLQSREVVDAEPEEEAVGSPGVSAEQFRETRSSRWLPPGPRRDLYGAPLLRSRFFNASAYVLGELGYRSSFVVESTLIYLSFHPSLPLRQVVATALASWRLQPEGSGRLYRLLEQWMRDSYQRQMLLHSVVRGRVQDHYGRLRSVVALCLGVASCYDPPNQLPRRLIELTEQFLEDRHVDSLEVFRSHTVPALLARHLHQLEPWYRHWVLRLDLIEPIALGWQFAYAVNPEPALRDLRRWHAESLEMKRASVRHSPRLRECRLAMVGVAYGLISHNFDGLSQRLTRADALEVVSNLHLRERHSLVRGHMVRSLLLQVVAGNEQAEEVLIRALSRQTVGEQNNVRGLLGNLYLQQRFELVGGEDLVAISGLPYDLWYSKARPKTQIETMFERWLSGNRVPAPARQLALEAMVVFSSTRVDYEEAKMTRLYRAFLAWLPFWHHQFWARAYRWELFNLRFPPLRESSLWLLAVPLGWCFRLRVHDLVPTLSFMRQHLPESTLLRLQRWKTEEPRGSKLGSLSRQLRWISWLRPEWVSWVMLICSAVLVVVIVMQLGAAYRADIGEWLLSLPGMLAEWLGDTISQAIRRALPENLWPF
ncbi:MAG: hypothetical protein AAGD01_06505 [Acidobacteriota bacterium]